MVLREQSFVLWPAIQLQKENMYQDPVMILMTGIIFPQVHQQLRLEELEEEVILFQQVL